MFGSFQRALHRGVLAGLQQQQQCQQQCQQLEVLGLQAARSFFNDYRPAKALPKKLKQLQRRNEAVQKVTSKKQQAEPAAAAAAGSSSSSSLDAGTAASVAAAEAASSAPAAAAAAAQRSGPVSSPLSQVPRAPGSSSSSSNAAATPAAAPAQEDSKSSWVPSWLDTIMDYPRRRRAPKPPPGTTSPLQSNAPDAAAAVADPKGSSKEDDGWAHLEQWRNMSLEVYQTIIANDPAAEGGERAPRPAKPANKGAKTTLRARMDTYRVMHARYEQQSNLISIMDENDKLRAKLDPLAFMKDRGAIARIARTAQSTEGAVMDLLHSFHRRRDFAELMLQHREQGKPMPLTGDQHATNQLHIKLQQQRARREHFAVLKELMDPQNCQLKAWAGVVGKSQKCMRTGLPYKDCCGSQLGMKLGRKALRQ